MSPAIVNTQHKWGMVIDLDRCTGCNACVVACQAENNVPINTEDAFKQKRAIEWIRVERYWEGEFPNVKARYIPIPCQECEDAPCEPVCPVFATYHNSEGLNVQIYNRCVGTRFCGNNCAYNVRFFNFWEPVWPESLRNQLNPDVTVRSRGIMEKCSFCIQRIRRAELKAASENRDVNDTDINSDSGMFAPACVRACPSDTILFGNLADPNSKISQRVSAETGPGGRGYHLLDYLGTNPNVLYLKKVTKEPYQ